MVDLFEDQREITSAAELEADAVLASLLLRRIARPPAQLRNTVPRFHRLFVDLPKRHPELVERFDFDARSRELCGVGLARYIAICFTFFTRFGTSDLRDPTRWILSVGYYADASSVSADEFARVMKTVSATPDQWRREYEREISDGFEGLDDHRPIVRRPICEIRPNAFIPIDFAGLAERLVGDGLYWRLRPEDGQRRSDYVAAVGKLLEEHLYEVARDVYPASVARADERLLRTSRTSCKQAPGRSTKA